jgi:hypothetical protein
MKKISVYLLSAILVTCSFSPHIWARDNPSVGKCVEKNDRSERFKMDIKKGAPIAQRAKQLRATNKGFAKAYAELLRRGGKPLFEEAGVSVIARDTKAPRFMKASTSGAQSLSGGDYEMTFFPFDTGDDAVWEGAIYVKGLETGETWAVSFSTTEESLADAEIFYENYYDADGNLINPIGTPPREGGPSQVKFVGAGYVGEGYNGAPNAVVYQRFRSWVNCVNANCFAASRACIWTGPFYFICFNSWCLGSMINCLPPLNL